MNDKIIQLPGTEPLPSNPIEVVDGKPLRSWCGHERITIDRHQRTVQCADCAAMLDPFDYLRDQGQLLQRAWSSYREVTRRANEVAERVEVLKKEEQRIKSRIKRAREGEQVIDVRGKDRL